VALGRYETLLMYGMENYNEGGRSATCLKRESVRNRKVFASGDTRIRCELFGAIGTMQERTRDNVGDS
jgi:hypothetical protein